MSAVEVFRSRGWITTQRHPSLPLTVCKYTRQYQQRDDWEDGMLGMRGAVFDDDGRKVNAPLNKFFNMGEAPTPTGEYVVQEKLDGTCVVVFRWLGTPIVHTLGSFTSQQARAAERHIERTYGWDWLDEATSYVFEWMDPDNFVTLPFRGDPELVLLAAIRREGELDPDVVEWPGRRVQLFAPLPLDELPGTIANDAEGFVLVFSAMQLGQRARMKVKGEHYLALHRAKWGLSERVVWEYVYQRPNSDRASFLGILDEEARAWFDSVAERMAGEIRQLEDEAAELLAVVIADDPDIPTGAKRIQALPEMYRPWLFLRLNGRTPPENHFAKWVKPKGSITYASE